MGAPGGAVEWDWREMLLIRGYELTFGNNETYFATVQFFYCKISIRRATITDQFS